MKQKLEKSMAVWGSRALALALTICAPVLAFAQNAIQSVTATQQGDSEVVRVELAQPLGALPTGFAVQTPPRIALDLPGVSNALGKSAVDVNQGNLRSVSVAQSGERTRLVLNLKAPANYRAQIDGKALIIVLDGGAVAPAMAAAPAASAPTRFAESMNANQLPIRDLDFRRGSDGAGRVIVELPNNQVGVDIRQQGRGLVVEFLRSSVPDSLRRRLDVTDFGTPVQTITTTQSGDRVRMVVEPRGAWEHSAYQTDNQFVLEVRAQKIDPNKLVQGAGYAGEKLSLNFQNIEVRALLQVIADFTNFNVVTSDTVTGNVTLRLKDVPWDQALDIILQAKNLGLRKSGNVILIAPKDELNAKEKIELEAKQQIASLEPLRTQAFQLNYAKAEDIAKGLTGQQTGTGQSSGGTASRILSPRGSVVSEARTNQLFVSDIPSKLEEIQALIAKIDIAVRQVLIESRIVIADDTFGRSLGVRLGAQDLRGVRGGVPGYGVGGDTRVAIGGNLNAVGSQTLQSSGSTSTDFNDTNFFNLPASTQFGDPATFALSLFGASANRFLNLEISALEADGKGKVVSSPRVVTADQQKALIEQGEELPYQVATSSGATSLQFRKANLKLEVTPQITPEGNVILDVDVTKDSVGRSTSAGFAINTKHVKTQVLVENGGTVVIGGIFEQNEREDVSKVPLLGDIPVVGNLFKSRTSQSSKSELLIFLTPKVVSDRTAAR
ncbi:type IV pilus secretin PilQ [Piscinibacter koreensis]|uniref:Type IV pilus biogenesis and competence protein PilQ n=1 Tax=Piscinibacter koreensis TaxID=2742824 RepID=A0A7Y6NLZ0_9BURK|nr:type IV pilus secretin PilQ [Schlegelella koreensis]NUZ05641.1 type IV pilus secretin PilQ [Schlegelella koreensis]